VKPVTLLEWELIENYNVFTVGTLPDEAPDSATAFLDCLSAEEEEEMFGGGGSSSSGSKKIKGVKEQIQQNQAQRRVEASEKAARDVASKAVTMLVPLGRSNLQRILSLLRVMRKLYDVQADLNGAGTTANNMWIVKPAAKSRGRGISTFKDLGKLLRYIDAGNGGATHWVVQKYMENPMVVARRKFDIRQWVLVTDWNPLTVYFYGEFYVRLSVDEYTTDDDKMEDSFVHLVNNSIGKTHESFGKTFDTEDGGVVEGYMMGMSQFGKFLKHTTGEEQIPQLQERMKEIAKCSLMCASEMIEHRKNSWELYGFDFMVDDKCNAWLIEINSSPACDYSTKVTERYVQMALVELLGVTLDMREWDKEVERNSRRKNKVPEPEKPDTGLWECIYKGPLLETPVASFGVDMTLKGTPMKLPKKTGAFAPVPRSMMGAPMVSGEKITSVRDLRKSFPLSQSDTARKQSIHQPAALASPRGSKEAPVSAQVRVPFLPAQPKEPLLPRTEKSSNGPTSPRRQKTVPAAPAPAPVPAHAPVTVTVSTMAFPSDSGMSSAELSASPSAARGGGHLECSPSATRFPVPSTMPGMDGQYQPSASIDDSDAESDTGSIGRSRSRLGLSQGLGVASSNGEGHGRRSPGYENTVNMNMSIQGQGQGQGGGHGPVSEQDKDAFMLGQAAATVLAGQGQGQGQDNMNKGLGVRRGVALPGQGKRTPAPVGFKAAPIQTLTLDF